MKVKKPSEMTNEELIKIEKTIKVLITILILLTVLLLLIISILFLKKDFTPLIVLPFSLTPIIIINSNSLKEIKKEIAFRELR